MRLLVTKEYLIEIVEFSHFGWVLLFCLLGVLNLRGSDISFNPVFKSYLIVYFNFADNTNNSVLYINSDKVPEEVKEYLQSINVSLSPYTQVFTDIATIG